MNDAMCSFLSYDSVPMVVLKHSEVSALLSTYWFFILSHWNPLRLNGSPIDVAVGKTMMMIIKLEMTWMMARTKAKEKKIMNDGRDEDDEDEEHDGDSVDGDVIVASRCV